MFRPEGFMQCGQALIRIDSIIGARPVGVGKPPKPGVELTLSTGEKLQIPGTMENLTTYLEKIGVRMYQ